MWWAVTLHPWSRQCYFNCFYGFGLSIVQFLLESLRFTHSDWKVYSINWWVWKFSLQMLYFQLHTHLSARLFLTHVEMSGIFFSWFRIQGNEKNRINWTMVSNRPTSQYTQPSQTINTWFPKHCSLFYSLSHVFTSSALWLDQINALITESPNTFRSICEDEIRKYNFQKTATASIWQTLEFYSVSLVFD